MTEEGISIAPVQQTTTIPPPELSPPPVAQLVPVSKPAAPAPFNYRPTTFDGALKLADMLASSDLVPKDYRGKSANCFVAMQWGHELDMNPLQAVQSIAVINGKPGLYGDAGKAVLLSKGCQIVEADAAEIKETETARCTIHRTGRQPVTRTFSISDAQKAGLWNREGPWRNYPYRMLAWRAFWNAARDAAADLLKGMGGVEELADMGEPQQATPPAPRVEPPRRKPKEGDPIGEATHRAPPPEPESGPGPDPEDAQAGKVPASAAMLAHVRKVLERGSLSTADVAKKFPALPESLEGISVADVNALLAWAKNPAE